MITKSRKRGMTIFLLMGVVFVLACGISTTPPASQAIDPTVAALQMQATAMILQMTQAALPQQGQGAATPTQNNQSTPLPVPATPSETQPVYTATSTPRIILQPLATEILYGEKQSSYPRKNSGILYGFKGYQGDIVTIVLESSDARPNTPSCSFSTTSTTFTLQTPNLDLPATVESPHLSSMRDYELQDSAAYYIMVTCGGGSCNGNCIQADLSLDKK